MARIVLVSDCNFLVNRKEVICIGSAPEEVLEEIEELTRTETVDLFLISLDYIPIGQEHVIQRTTHTGIEVLKRLRLKRYQQHCVVFSFLPREHFILSDPKNLLLYAPGVTYYQLPIDLQALDFNRLKALQAPQDLSAFFRAEVQVADDRHFIANWWGVYTLWQVHKVIQTYQGQAASPQQGQVETLEDFFKDTQAWKHMNSLQGLLAQYLNPLDETSILAELQQKEDLDQREITTLPEEVRERLENVVEELETEIGLLQKSPYELGDKEVELRLKQKYEVFVRKLLEAGGSSGIPSDELREELKEELQAILEKIEQDNERKCIQEGFYNLIEAISAHIEKVFGNKEQQDSLWNRYLHIKDRCNRTPPQIIYVDDQAEEGWSKVFQYMLYGGENQEYFKTIVPDKKIGDDEEFVDEVIKAIEAKVEAHEQKNKGQLVLLILDLRLRGEKGDIPVSQLSGIKVLARLKKALFSYPILITTASNKRTPYRKALQLGALAYWQKKGLDERNDTDSLLENYMSFMQLVYHLALENKSIPVLYKKLIPYYKECKANRNIYWWQTKFWIRELGGAVGLESLSNLKYNEIKKDTVTREKIWEVIEETIELYRDFIRNKEIENGYKNMLALYNSLIVIYLYKVFEIIYFIPIEKNGWEVSDKDKLNEMTPDKKMTPSDKKIKYNNIIHIRNKAVHRKDINTQDLHTFIDYIFDLLKNEAGMNFGIIPMVQDLVDVNKEYDDTKIYTCRIRKFEEKKTNWVVHLKDINTEELKKEGFTIAEGKNIRCIFAKEYITKEELYKLIKESKQIEFAICKEQKYIDKIEISIKNNNSHDQENPDMS
ncbi:MAG: response regulator [Capnocytophaga sp.]|nr:MAG: response regulator [Capnocytophaga sp.]